MAQPGPQAVSALAPLSRPERTRLRAAIYEYTP
jgi:hypothetical protein